MDTKAAFDKWFEENMYLAGQCFCTESEKRRMLKAWTASRAEIEIELPEEKPSVTYTNSGFNWALRECKHAITSHGIRIKGKTE